ncbi:hypothetical protein KP509_14G038100 [Ceratopteris richardii]|uniref:J domain-containing protein n=1 Tax=Ceratopteris richardii TaxID=49495 RepID=A0A8T2T8P2_CERRI|nr:hypothetical protein KP509_14G038100 [Ceratopteris richardii]KAH7415329.1 hypothetical protein KP509_14G038100 [Ceratopteris richardii]
MPEDGPDGELYALLHLSPEATDEEIRRAYRQWAQVYHPDKHKTPQMQGIATESFQKIREAYEILSDEKKRKIYDLYGMEGINSGMELGPKLNTLDEVLKGLEKLKQQRQEQVMKERMHHSGSLVFDIALAEKRLMLRGMTSTTEVQTHLSKKNVLALGGNIVLREQLGGGALSAVLRHQISADSNVEAVVMVGLRSLISIQTSRRLSSRSTGGIGFSLSLRDGSMNLTNIWTRQLSETTEGNIHLMIGTNPALSTGLRRQTQRNLSSGELKVGMGTYSLMAQYGHEFSSHSRGQITGRIGSNAVEVEIGGERTISHHSALAMSCTISIHGISYKFSFSRGGQKFVVPILLTPVVTPVIATGALMLPASAYFLLKTYLLKPYFSRRKQKKQREQRRLSAAQVTRH